MMKIALLSLLSALILPSAFANGVERGAEVEVPAPIYMPFIRIYSPTELETPCEFSGDPGVKGPDGCIHISR